MSFAAVARSFSIFDIDYGVDDGDLSIFPPPPSSSERRGFLTAMVVVLCARFAPSPLLDDVSHRKGCSRMSFGRNTPPPVLDNGNEVRTTNQVIKKSLHLSLVNVHEIWVTQRRGLTASRVAVSRDYPLWTNDAFRLGK